MHLISKNQSIVGMESNIDWWHMPIKIIHAMLVFFINKKLNKEETDSLSLSLMLHYIMRFY